MLWLTLLFLSLLQLSQCKDCIMNHTSEETWEKKLSKYLKEKYMRSENPHRCNVTEVEVRFSMQSFTMDSQNDIFTMNSRMLISWHDSRLQWNPSEFDGVSVSYFKHFIYWVPYVILNNREGDEYGIFHSEVCMLDKDGLVICRPSVTDSVQCITRMSNWPYDTQSCTLEYTTSPHQTDVHLIPGAKKVVSREGTNYGSEYTIVDYHQVSNTSDKIQLRITFIVTRNGDTLAAAIILPSILLSILTVCSILLEVSDRNRLLIILFSMYCHCFYLLEIGWEIPKHSVDPPIILLFYRSSVILTSVLIVMTVVLGKLSSKKSAPPPVISSVYSFVYNSRFNCLIWPRWKTKLISEAVDVKCVEVWNGFANIVNSVCLLVSALIYSVMMLLFIPVRKMFV